MELPAERISRAKELLATVHHAAMATVNQDGTPHNTPFHFQIDETHEHIYWASNPESLHSQNLARTGQAFIVIYMPGNGDGLYIRVENAHIVEGAEFEEGLRIRNEQRAKAGRKPITAEHYHGSSVQQMYRADLVQFWINEASKNEDGNITNDWRTEINKEDLLG